MSYLSKAVVGDQCNRERRLGIWSTTCLQQVHLSVPGAGQGLEKPDQVPFWCVAGTETHLLLFCLPPQGEDPQVDSMLTYAPASRAEHPEGHPPQTLSQSQPQELGLKGDGRVQKRTLIGKLIAYLAMMPASPTKAGPLTPYELMRMPWRISRKRLSPTEDAGDLPDPGDGESASPPLWCLWWAPAPPVFPALVLGWGDARFLQERHLPGA